MDTSLKKLSRLELMEILVQLSEDNDALALENRRLRQALAAKPRMKSTAKVGSIAELAMQTNGFFEAAQNAADDYLREIKRMRDQLSARMDASAQPALSEDRVPQVQAEAEAALRDAHEQASAIVKRANSQADAILADARAASDEMIEEANKQAHAIVTRANRQADAVMAAASNEAAKQSFSAASSDASAPIRGRHARPAAEAS